MADLPRLTSIQEFVRITRLLMSAFLLGILTFGGIAYYLVTDMGEGLAGHFGDAEVLLRYLTPVVALAAAAIQGFSFRQLAARAAEASPLEVQLSQLLTAYVVRAALLEGAAFFALVTYLLTGDTAHLIVAIFAAGLLLLFIPTEERTAEDLHLRG